MRDCLAARCVLLIARLARDEHGADLLEYALLTALVGLAGFAAFNSLTNQMGTAYHAWDTNQQNLWIPPAPASAP